MRHVARGSPEAGRVGQRAGLDGGTGGQDQAKGKIFRVAHLGYYDDLDMVTVMGASEVLLKQAVWDRVNYGLGVGAGNVPAYVEASANLPRAVNDVVLSKAFDNGMVCASEQAVILDSESDGDRTWYLRVPDGAKLPVTASPEQALGEDLFEHLPAGAEGRRWRSLLSEAQIVLHNHPHNARRAAAGLAPVNSLWFWGGGMLPDHVSTGVAQVHGGDVLLQALARQAGARHAARPTVFEPGEGDVLTDLRDARDLAALSAAWLAPAIAAVRRGALRELRLDFQDGAGCRLLRRHRWRFWRGVAPGFSRLQASPQAAPEP
mgnify:CR=1 FL=1